MSLGCVLGTKDLCLSRFTHIAFDLQLQMRAFSAQPQASGAISACVGSTHVSPGPPWLKAGKVELILALSTLLTTGVAINK